MVLWPHDQGLLHSSWEGRGGEGRFPLNLTLYEYEPLVNVALVLLLKIYDFEVEVSRVLRDQHVPGPPPPPPLAPSPLSPSPSCHRFPPTGWLAGGRRLEPFCGWSRPD